MVRRTRCVYASICFSSLANVNKHTSTVLQFLEPFSILHNTLSAQAALHENKDKESTPPDSSRDRSQASHATLSRLPVTVFSASTSTHDERAQIGLKYGSSCSAKTHRTIVSLDTTAARTEPRHSLSPPVSPRTRQTGTTQQQQQQRAYAYNMPPQTTSSSRDPFFTGNGPWFVWHGLATPPIDLEAEHAFGLVHASFSYHSPKSKHVAFELDSETVTDRRNGHEPRTGSGSSNEPLINGGTHPKGKLSTNLVESSSTANTTTTINYSNYNYNTSAEAAVWQRALLVLLVAYLHLLSPPALCIKTLPGRSRHVKAPRRLCLLERRWRQQRHRDHRWIVKASSEHLRLNRSRMRNRVRRRRCINPRCSELPAVGAPTPAAYPSYAGTWFDGVGFPVRGLVYIRLGVGGTDCPASAAFAIYADCFGWSTTRIRTVYFEEGYVEDSAAGG